MLVDQVCKHSFGILIIHRSQFFVAGVCLSTQHWLLSFQVVVFGGALSLACLFMPDLQLVLANTTNAYIAVVQSFLGFETRLY